MLVSISFTSLNAAAKKEPTASQELFALYDPSCTSCCKSIFDLRGGIDEKNKQLTLTLTKDGQPISDTVKLWANALYVHPNDGRLPHRFRWDNEHVKLSLAALLQYKGIGKVAYATKSVYLSVEDHAFRNIYFCGKFLIIKTGQDSPLLVPPTHKSITTIIQTLKSTHASDPSKFSHPVIIVDINHWLTNCFGADWIHKLPTHRHPVSKEVMTQTEWDAMNPKEVSAKKTS
jgi:hypothetical protein